MVVLDQTIFFATVFTSIMQKEKSFFFFGFEFLTGGEKDETLS